MSVQLSFGLLGPFDVRVAGRQVPVRSPKCRILLAALLLEPGRVVPTADLIEAIWGASKPDNPRRAAQLCVTRVRSILRVAGAPTLIATGADGYRADLAPDSVDVARFQSLLAQADRGADRSDLAGEQTALTKAIGLWRGEPLADVPSDVLQQAYGHRLTEQRLQALERRIDLNLREGRHVEAVDELVTLTAQHPLRENLWVQLMTALDRAGRRADALNTYHLMRRQLADELGIEPGIELRELHARVLDGGAAAEACGTVLPAVPRQVPPEVIGFAGRTSAMRRMYELLDSHEATGCQSPILVVTGMAGMGKTALALHWARRVADRFPDGQLWVDLRGYHHRAATAPEQALAYVLRAFGIHGTDLPADLDGQVALYRSIMDGRRMLVVLDNASSVDQVRPLLPGGTGSLALITSRNELTDLVAVEGAQAIRLAPFTPQEAQQMLEPRLGAQRIATDPDAVDRIIARCAGLPLALAIVAARAVARPSFALAALDHQLADTSYRLDSFSIPDGGSDVRTVFSWSYQALTAPTARLFRHLGLHPTTELSTSAAASLIGATAGATRLLLHELAAAHLVTEQAPDRFEMHDLLHAYATELAASHDAPEDRSAGQRRLLEWLTRTAFNARPLMQPIEAAVAPQGTVDDVVPLTFSTEQQARGWYEVERHNLVASVQLAYAAGFDDLCWRLAYAGWIDLNLSCAWSDLMRTHRVGLRAAERSGDLAAQAHMLSDIGVAYRSTGQIDRAIDTHRMALAMFQEVGDTPGVNTVFCNLGAAYRDAGRFDEALACIRRAYASDRARNEPGNMAISLYQIGATLTAAGRLAEALPVVQEARHLFCKIGHLRGQARALDLLATAHTRLGRPSAAIDCYREAVDIYQEAGDPSYQATMLNRLGDALHETRQVRKSHDAWKRALDIYDELGVPDSAELRGKLSATIR